MTATGRRPHAARRVPATAVLARVAPGPVRAWRTRRRAGRAKPATWHLADRELLYVEIPKAATRSIRIALGHWAFPDLPLSWSAARRGREAFEGTMAPDEIALLPESTFTFAFVREPLQRLLSCYQNKLSNPSNQDRPVQAMYRLAYGIEPGMPFADFVDVVARVPDELAERHFRSQHRFLCVGDELVVDFLGGVESLTDDWAVLQERFGFPDLPHKNRTPVPSDLRTAYTHETALMAARRYERDIEQFGYADSVNRLLSALQAPRLPTKASPDR